MTTLLQRMVLQHPLFWADSVWSSPGHPAGKSKQRKDLEFEISSGTTRVEFEDWCVWSVGVGVSRWCLVVDDKRIRAGVAASLTFRFVPLDLFFFFNFTNELGWWMRALTYVIQIDIPVRKQVIWVRSRWCKAVFDRRKLIRKLGSYQALYTVKLK